MQETFPYGFSLRRDCRTKDSFLFVSVCFGLQSQCKKKPNEPNLRHVQVVSLFLCSIYHYSFDIIHSQNEPNCRT
jgi:hypothetical protein